MFGKYNLDIEYKCCGDGWKGKCSFFNKGKEGYCKYSKDCRCNNKNVTDFALTEEYNEMFDKVVKNDKESNK